MIVWQNLAEPVLVLAFKGCSEMLRAASDWCFWRFLLPVGEDAGHCLLCSPSTWPGLPSADRLRFSWWNSIWSLEQTLILEKDRMSCKSADQSRLTLSDERNGESQPLHRSNSSRPFRHVGIGGSAGLSFAVFAVSNRSCLYGRVVEAFLLTGKQEQLFSGLWKKHTSFVYWELFFWGWSDRRPLRVKRGAAIPMTLRGRSPFLSVFFKAVWKDSNQSSSIILLILL